MDKTTYISFPGLGIDEFKVKNVAIPDIFGRGIMWYGIIITLGIIAAVLYANYRAKRNEEISSDDVLDYAIYLVVFGVIGARLYYVFTKFSTFKADSLGDTLYNIIAIWDGGLAIYGGIIAGFIALVTVSLIKKIKLGRALDMIAPGVMIAQSIGRWGNFFNAEAYGSETTLPWRMGLRDITETTAKYVHPTFLYESLWNLIGFIIINIIYKKKKFDGQIFLLYISWYGFGRMFIESLRTDSLYVGDFRISQLVGFGCFFIGTALLVSMLISRSILKKSGAIPLFLTTEAPPAPIKKSPASSKASKSSVKTEKDEDKKKTDPETEPSTTKEEKKTAPEAPSEEKKDSEAKSEAPAEEKTVPVSGGFEISSSYGDDGDDDND